MIYANTGIDYRAYIAQQSKAHDEAAELVRTYRDYYSGQHQAKPTNRIKDVVGIQDNADFAINFMAMVVDAFAERLNVTGLDVQHDDETIKAAIEDKLSQWRRLSRFDAQQNQIHNAAGRDGRAYLMPYYDADLQAPQLVVNYAYDGKDGITAVYDHNGKMRYAAKRWIEEPEFSPDGKTTVQRMNVYYPGHIELWERTGKQKDRPWLPKPHDAANKEVRVDKESGLLSRHGVAYEATVIWWTQTQLPGGEPLGIPVIAFNNRDDGTGAGVSDIASLLILQELINKLFIDMQESADANAFALLVSTAALKDEDGEPIIPGPAQVLTLPGPNESVTRIPPGDMSQLINYFETLLSTLARISGVPLSRFTVTKAIAAEGTLKQQEAPLLAACEQKQVTFGNAWEDAMRWLLKLAAVFDATNAPLKSIQEIERLSIDTQWHDLSPRSENETADYAAKVADLGLPEEEIWSILGYDADKIAEFRQLLDDQANQRLEADIARARNQQFALLQQMGAQARERRTDTTGANGQQPESEGVGLPEALAVGA